MSASFLDSNILVYLFDERNHHKHGIAANLVNKALRTGNAVISFQVVQETLNVITTKLATPLDSEDTSRFFESVLLPLWKVNPGRTLYRRGLEIRYRYQFSFYDSLIVAAALEVGCGTLFTEDLQHGQEIGRLRIANPFMPDS